MSFGSDECGMQRESSWPGGGSRAGGSGGLQLFAVCSGCRSAEHTLELDVWEKRCKLQEPPRPAKPSMGKHAQANLPYCRSQGMSARRHPPEIHATGAQAQHSWTREGGGQARRQDRPSNGRLRSSREAQRPTTSRQLPEVRVCVRSTLCSPWKKVKMMRRLRCLTNRCQTKTCQIRCARVPEETNDLPLCLLAGWLEDVVPPPALTSRGQPS